MLEVFVNQYETMTFAEELHTIAFTAFLVGGAICCFVRKDKPSLTARPTMPSHRARRF